MTTFTPDVLIKLAFPIADPTKLVVRTNAKREALEGLLSAWVQDQVGAGKDENAAVALDVYNINIGLRIEDDYFGTASDAGNKGLTCGLVMSALQVLSAGNGTVLDLE